MRIKMLGLALAVAVCSPAVAAPIYLDCWLPAKPSGQQPWSISLNEENASVTFSHPLATVTEKALFTPDEITWSKGDMKIDRTTLQFTRRMTFGGLIAPRPADVGQCKVSAKKRAT